jgi:hypothetical protein
VNAVLAEGDLALEEREWRTSRGLERLADLRFAPTGALP